MGAAHTTVLGKSNSAVRKEVAGFDLIRGCLNQLAKLPTLLLVNRCLQILNFGRVLANEDDQSNIGDPSHPGIADQLWIQSQQTQRLLRVAAGRRFPVDNAFRPVQFTNSVNVRKELAPGW